MAPHPHPLAPIDRIRAPLDAGRGHRLGVRVLAELDGREALEEADEHERDLVVRELLPQADAWAGVEGEKDERVRSEILVQPFVEETVWVEFLGWSARSVWVVYGQRKEGCTIGAPVVCAAMHAMHGVR